MGHAIDMNLIEGSDWCNSKCLVDPLENYKGVRCFLSQIQRDETLRWGGDFTVKDVVHIDDGLNYRDPLWYNELYGSLQTDCE